MKLKSTTANNIMMLLNSIPREKLYNESMTSVENKWKAMTVRSNISGLIKDANGDFIKKLDEAQEILNKINEEGKLLKAQYEEPKDEKPEDKKVRVAEEQKAFNELNERANKEILKKTGLVFTTYMPDRMTLAKFEDDKNDNEIEVKLDTKFKHLEFLKEQMEENIFKLNVSDEVISEIAAALEV
jgi:hypothetical protein